MKRSKPQIIEDLCQAGRKLLILLAHDCTSGEYSEEFRKHAELCDEARSAGLQQSEIRSFLSSTGVVVHFAMAHDEYKFQEFLNDYDFENYQHLYDGYTEDYFA